MVKFETIYRKRQNVHRLWRLTDLKFYLAFRCDVMAKLGHHTDSLTYQTYTAESMYNHLKEKMTLKQMCREFYAICNKD